MMSNSFTCFVELLDESIDKIEFKYKKNDKGQALLDHVCKELKLEEKDYFGLRMVNKDKRRCWVDLMKPLYKQFKGINAPRTVKFRVKFYPISATKLKEEISRYQLYLQLRRDLRMGRLHCTFEEAARLGSYIIQASLGDYNQEEHEPGYVSEFDLFPTLSEKLRERIEELHSTTMSGETASNCEGDFIEEASHLMTYGIDPFQVTDVGNTPLILGFSFRGVLLLRNGVVLDSTEWELVKKISHDGKHLHIVGISGQATKVKRSFHFANSAEAEHAGRCALEQQAFFSDNPQLTLRRSGSLIFKRNSFKFKGKTAKDAQEKSQSIQRAEPSVNRIRPRITKRRARSLNDNADDSGFPSLPEEQGSPGKDFDQDGEGKLMPPSDPTDLEPLPESPVIDRAEEQRTATEVLEVMDEIKPAREEDGIDAGPMTQRAEEEEQMPPLEDIIRAETSNHVQALPAAKDESPSQSTVSGSPLQAPEGKNNVNNHVDRPARSAEKDVSGGGLGIFGKVLLTLVLLTCAIVVFVVVLFETRVDFLDPVRKLDQVKMVKSLYYRPNRDVVIEHANHIYSDVLQPSAKYVHSQWHKVVTKSTPQK